MSTVTKLIPSIARCGFASLYSGMMTIVGGPDTTHGAWYGVGLSPRVTIRRMWTWSCIWLALTTSRIRASIASREIGISNPITSAPCQSRSRWSSMKTRTFSCRRNASQTPSPSKKPASITETLASGRRNNSPSIEIQTSALRGSSTYS